MNSGPPAQPPILMETPVLPGGDKYASFARQLAGQWNPSQSFYGNIHAPINMQSANLNSIMLRQNKGMEHCVPVLHQNMTTSVESNSLARADQEPDPDCSEDMTNSTSDSGQPVTLVANSTCPSEPIKRPSSAGKKKKKKPKKPSLKTALATDLPTMVPALIDAAEKQHQCPDCPRKFSWHFQLQQHYRTHSGERPFVCTNCQQAYKRREHLQRHERIHTGERPFECEVCLKKYRRKSQLIRHARIHTGERPYRCEACEKSFRRRGHLMRHFKVHSGGDVLQEAGTDLRKRTETSHEEGEGLPVLLPQPLVTT